MEMIILKESAFLFLKKAKGVPWETEHNRRPVNRRVFHENSFEVDRRRDEKESNGNKWGLFKYWTCFHPEAAYLNQMAVGRIVYHLNMSRY